MKSLLSVVCICSLVCTTSNLMAQQTVPVVGSQPAATGAALEQQYSYAIGLDMGMRFRSSEIVIDAKSLLAGLQAGQSGGEPKYDQKTCSQALQQLQTMMRNKAMAQQQVASVKNKKQSDLFLAKNKKQAGVKVTKSGLQYQVIQAGTGATPALSDTVRCDYRGTLIDGTEFDASQGKPVEFPVQGVIPGWTEALQLMKVGAKWKLFIPAELAYGNQQKGPLITPGSTLIFDIELLGIQGK